MDKDSEVRIGYNAVIPSRVLQLKEISPSHKLVYGLIVALATSDGYCFASNKYLAEMSGFSKVRIAHIIMDLKTLELVKVEITRNEKKEIISRKIFPYDNPYERYINNKSQNDPNVICDNTYCQTGQYPNVSDDKEKYKDINNISNKVDDTQKVKDFNTIWSIYPRKDGKNQAYKHYCAWLTGRKFAGETITLTNKEMYGAVSCYREHLTKNKTEKQYIKMGSTFFNDSLMDWVEVYRKEQAND